jgi:hypothetical protein
MDRRYMVTLFDMLKYIVKIDYPQNYPAFSEFVIKLVAEIQMTDLCVVIFKEVKEVIWIACRYFLSSGNEKELFPRSNTRRIFVRLLTK